MMHKCSPLRPLLLAALLSLLAPAAHADWIWTEGEKPVKQSMHRHPWWYDQVKKDQFSGGDFISNFSDKDPGEATYELSAKKAGAYEFWVRANPVQSALSYRLNSGAWTAIHTEKDSVDSINVAADGKPDLRYLAWIKAGKVDLKAGKNTVEFRMDSPNSNHGYLDCFVLSTDAILPSGTLKPDQLIAAAKEREKGTAGWLPFTPGEDHFVSNAALDLRFLNEKFAGEHGQILAKNGHFIQPVNQQPIRFWAVNGVGNAATRDELQRAAKTLAKHGVNLVRLHGGMYDDNGTIDPAKIQLAIATVEELKAQGIYSHFSIYFPLWLTPNARNSFLKGYDGKTHPFAALLFNPDFQKQYQSWWTALLTTPSAKTGKRLIDDPAVLSLELQNEDSFFFWTFNDKDIPAAQLQLLESQFADWLKIRYGSLDKAFAAWNVKPAGRDAPQENRVSFRPLWNIANERTPRDQDTADFLLETQTHFYKNSVTFLRTLGFKGMITASNWFTASAKILGPLERLSYTPGDFIDRHGYFGCLHKGDNASWSIREGHTYADRSALRFDPEEPGKPRQYSNPVEDVAYNNLPSMISETTFERPNRFRSEAPLYYAAYGALQDTDAIVHFAFDSAQWRTKPGFFMQPWTLMSPSMMAQFPAAAIIYRKALVSPGDLMIDLNLNTPDLLHLQGSPLAPEASFDELRLKDVPKGLPSGPAATVDPLIHFVGRTNINFVDKPRPSTFKDFTPFIDRAAQKVTSSTGQLVLDYGKGVLAINTPNAQGLSGNLKAAGPTALKDVTISSDLDLGHIILVSLDDKPLATSSRILLQVMSEEENFEFLAPESGKIHKITNIGKDPWMFKELTGTVKLRRPDAASLKAIPLDFNGYPAGPATAAAEIELSPKTLYYLLSK